MVGNLMEKILKGIHSNREIFSHEEDVWGSYKKWTWSIISNLRCYIFKKDLGFQYAYFGSSNFKTMP